MNTRYISYYWLAALAYLRGWFGARIPSGETCTTGLNGRGEARIMYVKHNWRPYIYRRVNGVSGMSRTFLTNEIHAPKGWIPHPGDLRDIPRMFIRKDR